MIYAEACYFGGFHFQHIVQWQEYRRIERNRQIALACIRTKLYSGVNALGGTK
jgi:hypothetical protein